MKTKRLNVAGKALDRIKRVLKQIFPEILALGKKGIGDRNDLTANGLRLEDIEDLARRRPENLGSRLNGSLLYGLRHEGQRIDAGIGNATGKDGQNRGGSQQRRHRQTRRPARA